MSRFQLTHLEKMGQYIEYDQIRDRISFYPAGRLNVKASAAGKSKPAIRVEPLDHRRISLEKAASIRANIRVFALRSSLT